MHSHSLIALVVAGFVSTAFAAQPESAPPGFKVLDVD